jgi:predicted secreted Zn-dependent protease
MHRPESLLTAAAFRATRAPTWTGRLAEANRNVYYSIMQRFHPHRLRRLIPAALACALLLAAVPAMADVVRTVSTEYYMVDGTRPTAILLSLKRSSPVNEGTKTYQANTRTDIRTSYNIEQTGDKCRIKNVVVHLHLTYLYPKLRHSVDFETRKWWQKLYRQLEIHERIHGEISTKAAYKLSDTLERIPPGDCYNFKSTVKVKARRILDQMKKDQRDYDALTQHGFKQKRNMGRYP